MKHSTQVDLVLKLGNDNDLSQLSNVLTTADPASVKEFVQDSCRTGDGPAVFKYVLMGLGWGTVNDNVEKLRLGVVRRVVEEIIKNPGVPNKNATKFLDSLYGEVDQFNDFSVSKLLGRCMEELEQNEDRTGLRWLPLLGKLLSVVEIRENFVSYEEENGLRGVDYKENMVRDICNMSWDQDRITSICSMFKDVKLSADQQNEVFEKLCRSLPLLPAHSIPPLVFQMLQLAKDSASLSNMLVNTVNEFFSTKLSLEDRQSKTNMDIESLDLISEDHSVEELQQAEGTVVFHLTQAAKTGHRVAKEMVKLVKASSHAPELVLSPFSLFMALALTSVKTWKEQLLDSLRMAVIRSIMLEEKRNKNAWLRTNLPRSPDTGDLLSQVIGQSCKAGGWDLIGQGLVDLGFALLDHGSVLKVDSKLKAVHNLGARLLLKVVKKQSHSASSVMEPLTSRILVSKKAPQYTEALMIIVKDTATILMEQPKIVSELVENIQRLSYPTARRTLSGLLPLVRFSRALRDSIILVLRKALFSGSVQTRRVGTTGVMLLLKTFKISTSRSVSQLSQSSGSLSQLAVDVHRGAATSNEALCIEMLGVLKRCLGQQGEVRLTLYQGIMEVVAKNPELCEGVLELVYSHVLFLWGEEGKRQRWMLDLDLLGREGEEGWILEEPVGWFLHCIQMLVGKGQQVVGEECETLDKLVELVEEMALQYSESEVGDLGFDDTDNFDRKTKDGKRRSTQLEQLQGILEALMEYLITHGADQEENKSKMLLNLQRNHSALGDLMTRSLQKKKAKKGDKKEKAGEKDATKDGEKGDKSEPTNGKKGNEETVFSPPPHCFSMKCLSLILSSILLDRSPANQGALSVLRSDRDFTSFVMSITSSKLSQINTSLTSSGDEGSQSDSLFRYLINISRTFFDHSLVCQEQVQAVVQESLSCLLQVLKILLAHFPRRKLTIISSLTDTNPGVATEQNLNPVLVPALKKVMKKLANLTENLDNEEDEEITSNIGTTVTIFTLLFNEVDHNDGIEQVKDWIKRYTENLNIQEGGMLKPIVDLLLQSVLKVKTLPSLGLELAKGLHSLTGDLDTSVQVEMVEKHAWLTDNTKDIVLPLLLDHMEAVFDSCDLSITWLKALSSTSTKNTTMTIAETNVCLLLAKQVNAASELVKTAFPLGQPMDGVLKQLVRLYTVMGSLTKYFTLRTKQGKAVVSQAKFDKLALMINGQLTKHVYNLITWLESKQKERDQQAAAARAAKHKTVDPSVARAKVLRESRYIPNLILKIEMLEKDLIKLGKRVGQNLSEGNKLSVSRDFRIKFSEEMMNKLREEEEEENESDDDSDDSADDSRLQTIPPTNDSTVMNDVTNASRTQDDPSQEPPSKRSKLGKRKENTSLKSQ